MAFITFICPPNEKNTKMFQGFTPNPYWDSVIEVGQITNKKSAIITFMSFLFQLLNDAWGRKRLQVKKDFLKQRS